MAVPAVPMPPAMLWKTKVSVNTGHRGYFAPTGTPLGQGPTFWDCPGNSRTVGNYARWSLSSTVFGIRAAALQHILLTLHRWFRLGVLHRKLRCLSWICIFLHSIARTQLIHVPTPGRSSWKYPNIDTSCAKDLGDNCWYPSWLLVSLRAAV